MDFGANTTSVGRDRESSESASPSTDRCLSLLEVLSQHPMGLSVAEMTRHLGIPQNSVHRISATLHERGYLVRRESDKRFSLSNKLFDLGRPRVRDKSLVASARESLEHLRDLTGETVQLLVRSGIKGVVLDQVPGRHLVKVLGEVGMRVPLYSCAPGKALLASMPEQEFQAWCGDVPLKAYTRTTRSTREALLADLDGVRQRGYATDEAEGLEGIHCVGAALLDERGVGVAAITVMAPAFRLPPSDFAALGAECLRTCGKIREVLWS